jgi:CRISPR/Cas system-associated exonuclease Cas4 (RecB family)
MVGGGEVLQPALYGLAVEHKLGERVECGRLYYATVARNYTAIDVQLNEWTRRRTAQVLAIIDESLRNGFLPAAPRKDGCKGCEFMAVCGPYEEERAGVKSQVELGPLKELRRWK